MLALLATAMAVLGVHAASEKFGLEQEDTFAVILSASRYWFNYRHTSGALAAYDVVRSLGVPDDHIILMLAENHAWDVRNPFRGRIFNIDGERDKNLHPPFVEIDYVGSAVTPESFLRVITGRHSLGTPTRARLPAPSRTSNWLIYMTGHGGEGFLKFHDKDELTYADFGHALHDAWLRGRLGRALILSDTCQAGSLGEWIHSPGVTVMASSVTGQNSYAAGRDDEVGLSLTDGYTKALHEIISRAYSSPRARDRWTGEAAQAAGGGSGRLQEACTNALPDGVVGEQLRAACASLRTRDQARVGEGVYVPVAARLWQGQEQGEAAVHPPHAPHPHPSLSMRLSSLLLPDWVVSSTVNANTDWALVREGEGEEPLLRYIAHAAAVH